MRNRSGRSTVSVSLKLWYSGRRYSIYGVLLNDMHFSLGRIVRGIGMPSPERELVLNKGPQRYVFRYQQGEEDSVLDTLVQHAKDERTDFDWFDAELLRLKVTEIQARFQSEPTESCPVRVNRHRHTHFDRST